ncbi:MAG: 50S ribosomal protein L10 [archaeon]
MTPLKEATMRRLKRIMADYKVVGILNVKNMPSRQFQKIKNSMDAQVVMSKKSLIQRALEGSDKKGIADLIKNIEGQPALVFTNDNPFKLYAQIMKSRAPAACKGGEIAPNDITIEKGDTPFLPGPMLGELKSAGLSVAIEKGKIVVRETKTIVRTGQVIEPKVAGILNKLGIEPLEIGLDLTAAYENGFIFGKGVLAIDEAEYFNNFVTAHRNAFDLSVGAGIPLRDNIEVLLSKCYSESMAVAKEGGVIIPATVEGMLGAANAIASSLNQQLNIVKEVQNG